MRRRHFNWTEGSLSQDERMKLAKLVFGNPAKGPIVEFGTLIGLTTQVLAVNSRGCDVFTVDCFRWNPWGLSPECQRELAERMIWPLNGKIRVKLFAEHKVEFCQRYATIAPSLVFIDADHSYKSVKADIAWARSVGAAIVCGHDYYADGSKHPGVKQAVDEAGGPKELVGSLWVL